MKILRNAICLLLLLILFPLTAYSEEVFDSLPQDIQTFFRSAGIEYTIGSDAEFDDYCFVLATASDGMNDLYGFKRDEDFWSCWLKTSSAVFQSSGDKHVKIVNDTGRNNMLGEIYTAPTLSIVLVYDDYYESYISFSLQDEIWKLMNYWSIGTESFSIYVADDEIVFYSDFYDLQPEGILNLSVQRDLRYVDLSTIPIKYGNNDWVYPM